MTSALIGKTILNQYQVEEFSAHTPLGELYRALDLRTNRSVAFTLLPRTVAEDIESFKELEAQVFNLRGISHPNLTAYLGILQTPTSAFLLEEWVDGPSLQDILHKAPVSVTEALVYIKALCGAFEALHSKSYLHLHLAPELIRIDRNGAILLGGIAMARPFGAKDMESRSKYPPLYLAPEQFLREPLTPATDTYALAVLIYQLITGKWITGKALPKTSDAIRKGHLELAPPAPITQQTEIPDHFSRMVLWALRKKPADRLKTTTELLSSLALAARASVDKVPSRADSKSAPVTAAILAEWKFLPAPIPNLISQDVAPLGDRLAAITATQPAKGRGRIRILPIFLLLILVAFVSLFWLIKPAPPAIATPIQFTPFASDYTPPPSSTPLPRPTDENGGRIAFTCTRGDYNQLCMINRDGTGLSQLTDMEASNYYPVFTLDGSSLLFSSNRNGAFDLYLLVFDEAQLVQLTDHVGNIVSPDYSPDGRTIVFANRAGEGPTSIWMVNSDGLNPHQVYQGTGTIVAVSWSPDGGKIAYAMSVGVPQEYEIYTMDANGKNHLRISQGLRGIGGSIDWSPDSKYVLVYAGPYADKDIFKIDASTGKFTQLTSGGNNAGASYSPDGRYIVFNSMRNGDQADLYIMRSDGTNQQQLTNNPEPDWGAEWAP